MSVTAVPAPAAAAVEASKAPGKDKPSKPSKPAPKGPDVWMRMTWDDGITKRENNVGMEFNWLDGKKEHFKLERAWTDLRGPGGKTTLDPDDKLQRIVGLVTMGRILESEDAINALQSNVLPNEKAPAVKGGEFKFEFMGPKSEKPLVYFGVQKAMPAPLREALDAVREMKAHF